MINSRKIQDLKPLAQAKCLQFMKECEDAGLKVLIIQTLRDAEYQNSLYQIGRSKPGKKVTNCDGYKVQSNHQSGLAWDAVPVDAKGTILWNDSKKFEQMAKIAKELDIRAGFYWKMKDSPHFEL